MNRILLKGAGDMWKDKIKNIFSQGKEGENKKKLENLVVFLVILIITITIINVIWNDTKSSEENQTDSNGSNKRLAQENVETNKR